MILKVETDYCVQQLPSGEKIKHYFRDLKISGSFIHLPYHPGTKTIEVLYLNNGSDPHSQLVTQVFAKVATSGV